MKMCSSACKRHQKLKPWQNLCFSSMICIKIESFFTLRWVWKLKNHQQLTFGILKSDWCVVQHSRLFLRIAMILRMLASTHVDYWRLKEIFLTALKVKHDVHWNAFFEGPKMVKATFAFGRGMKTQKSPSPHVWDHRIPQSSVANMCVCKHP